MNDIEYVEIGSIPLEINSYMKMLEKKDHETYIHSLDVCNIASMIAQKLDLTKEEKYNVAMAALYHDIGKLWINKDILSKPGKLTDAEFLEMKYHPLFSYMIMRECGYPDEILTPILLHHEQESGTGYPFSYSQSQIPLSAAIVHIADVWSALVMPRCYKEGMSIAEAKRTIETEQKSKRSFRQEVLDVLIYDIFKEE